MPTLIAANQEAHAIAVDATTIYWTGLDGVYSAPKDGNNVTPTKLAAHDNAGASIVGIAVDASYVYWAEPGYCMSGTPLDGAIMKVPLSGGTPVPVVSMQCYPHGLAADTDTIYWTTEASVLKTPKLAGTVQTVAIDSNDPYAVIVDANNIYWTDYQKALKVAPKMTGSATTIASGVWILRGIAVDSTSVYWPVYDAGAVMKAPPVAGSTPTMIEVDNDQPTWIAVDATHVYWTDGGKIQRATLDGQQTETLAQGEYYPTAIALDDSYVYWGTRTATNAAIVGVKRIAK